MRFHHSDPAFDFQLAPFTVDSSHMEGASSVYASVFLHDMQQSRQVVADAARRKDFYGRVALVDGTTAAVGFGAATLVGHWWHYTIADVLGSDHPALQHAWNVMELAVLPTFRRRGLATALLGDLLAAQPCPRALLSVIVSNATARRFYENRGWKYLLSELAFPVAPEKRYALMAYELGARQQSRGSRYDGSP